MASWFQFGITEWVAIVCTLLYNYLLTRQKIACWFFGIVSSVAGSILFIENNLWGQFVLYVFYALMGVYGWWYWYTGSNHNRPVIKWSGKIQFYVFGGALIGCLIVLMVYHYVVPDASQAELDIAITVFSVIATFKESRKVLSGWLYWMVLNALSVWLYTNNQLNGLALLSGVYFFLSIIGYRSWLKTYAKQHSLVPGNNA